jgi:hypothetical protein
MKMLQKSVKPVSTPNRGQVVRLPRYNRNFSILLNIILEMSEEKQHLLLQHALELSNKRLKKRVPCLIYAVFSVRDEEYNGFILDINYSGAFIETEKQFVLNSLISLSFFDPFAQHEIVLRGRILWQTASGIGVSFIFHYAAGKQLKSFLTELRKYEGQVIRY